MTFLTDVIVRVFILYFLFRGAQKGFLRTLLGPIALILSCLIAFIYYYKTKNIFFSLSMAIFGPLFLTFIFSFVLKSWNTVVNNKESPSPLSRLAGALLSFLWRAPHLAIMLSFLALVPIPKNIAWFIPIQNNVKNSQSYALISRWTKNKIPAAGIDLNKLAAILKNPDHLKALRSTPEFQEIIADNKFRNLFSDQKILQAIKEKNFHELLSQPKIKAFFQDPELIKKFLALQKKIMVTKPDEDRIVDHYQSFPNTKL